MSIDEIHSKLNRLVYPPQLHLINTELNINPITERSTNYLVTNNCFRRIIILVLRLLLIKAECSVHNIFRTNKIEPQTSINRDQVII